MHVSADDARVSADDARVSADDARVSAADARVSAADARVSAADARVSAAAAARVSADAKLCGHLARGRHTARRCNDYTKFTFLLLVMPFSVVCIVE